MNMEEDLALLYAEPNALGQALGKAVPDWQGAGNISAATLEGRFTRVVPLNPRKHAQALFEANQQSPDQRMWTYLPYGPFDDFEAYDCWLQMAATTTDPRFFCIEHKTSGAPLGVLAYAAIDEARGSVELAHLAFSPALQQTVQATEAVYLMLEHAFALGYRRCEWKCHAHNAPSRNAALRFGFTYEGLFRNHLVVKGRNRDTCWFSITDDEWRELLPRYRAWLDESNINALGIQSLSLKEFLVN
ncbi:GNAT family N-acetyltransferase [Saccharophagus degradans]|uniref:GNAT family protein n=1 Tax=Saccharophagus degradans TaxID=86304 RepID=A0AAW7X797_9GAMM|nr:GNAT family protein [Saccharophagus degradans]MDO6423482.1 GNAT family protein [Saccharophagus degradans]MDO6606887.1 GNAT family protein [Saccharophagus degradans]WGO98193.1 GNAT family protein [Saccharophagus degradans]